LNSTDKNSGLDRSFSDARLWRQEAYDLRQILLECGLTEELKWGKPCYSCDGKNICIIQRMKGFLALLFFKGALLKDPDDILEAQGPNSHNGYRMRFTGVQDVARVAKSLKAYIREAIEVEKTGLKMKQATDLEYPEELIAKFHEDPAFQSAFDKLTPGRKRGYILYFSDAKQSKTRVSRIDKYRPNILNGKGLQERV
jgi:uncharacterized protein YdeI (YjbR/CyaY-like superfamily)